jgi:transposase InsO family protein
LRLSGAGGEAAARTALRAALVAARILGLATGTHLRQLRGLADPMTTLQARLQDAELRARLASEAAELLAARFSKISEKHRPYFTPAQRFRILEIRSLLAWSAAETARAFLVCPHTIQNWEKAADPASRTAGSIVEPTPPVRRAADVVRSTAQLLSRLGFGGQDLCARVLARAGWRLSARSIGRYRRERPQPPPQMPAFPSQVRPVRSRFVHHVWMMDLSEVKQFLGPSLHIAAVFDAFSRAPLALQVFERRPTASDMARLLRNAGRQFAHPRYLVSDLGGEFTARIFRKTAARLGVIQRFASADSLKATSRLERFWLTLKHAAGLYGLHRPLTVACLEARLERFLVHYLCFRPHEGLAGAVPGEVFLGREPLHKTAIEPPRGLRGNGTSEPPFEVAYLDSAARRYPILKLAA